TLPSNDNTAEIRELAERQILEMQRDWPQLRDANAYVFGRAHPIEPSPRIAVPVQFYRVPS
ncbi:MAG: hypothetical protein AABW75_02720, partial [Nanoarchaeota archaeon]